MFEPRPSRTLLISLLLSTKIRSGTRFEALSCDHTGGKPVVICTGMLQQHRMMIEQSTLMIDRTPLLVESYPR